jgi:hypothetical protein
MGDVSDLLRPPRDLLFIESVLLEVRLHPRDECFDVKKLRRETAIMRAGLHRRWN